MSEAVEGLAPAPAADTAQLVEAFLVLYDGAVQVLDLTNPDLKRERQRLSLALDKYEDLAHRVREPREEDPATEE